MTPTTRRLLHLKLAMEAKKQSTGPPRLMPANDNKAPYGWISPNGDYFPCPYAGHDGLSARIVEAGYATRGEYGNMDGLEKAGWIHLSDGAFYCARFSPTRRSMDRLFDICEASRNMGIYERFQEKADRMDF